MCSARVENCYGFYNNLLKYFKIMIRFEFQNEILIIMGRMLFGFWEISINHDTRIQRCKRELSVVSGKETMVQVHVKHQHDLLCG